MALRYCREALQQPAGEAVLRYLTEQRCYTPEAIKEMGLGACTAAPSLRAYLQEQAFTEAEIRHSGFFVSGVGETHPLVMCWPEPSGRARPDSIRTGGPDGDNGTHNAVESGEGHREGER